MHSSNHLFKKYSLIGVDTSNNKRRMKLWLGSISAPPHWRKPL